MFYFLVEDGIDRVITLTDFICLELTETGKVTILIKNRVGGDRKWQLIKQENT